MIPWSSVRFTRWRDLNRFVESIPIGTIYEWSQTRVVPKAEYELKYYRATYNELKAWGYIK